MSCASSSVSHTSGSHAERGLTRQIGIELDEDVRFSDTDYLN
jgi:hypothetical protein